MKFAICIFLGISSALPLPLSENNVRIIGGGEAEDSQFKFAASIVYKTSEGSFFCAGTLYRKFWIVTAGQCAYKATEFAIRLGSNTRQGDDGQKFISNDYLLAPEFSADPLMNDFALIRLPDEATFDDFVSPIWFMDSLETHPDYDLIAIGWGATSDSNSNFSDKLRFIHMRSITNDKCKTTYGDQITEDKLCAVGTNNEGTCLGDSGGPLIQYITGDTTMLVGVASFLSKNGCENSDPSGFTRVFLFNDWVMNKTHPDTPWGK